MALNNMLPYVFLITVWSANINDLIRGHWFYYSTGSILFWNIVGVLALIGIILESRQDIRRKGKR